MIKFNDIKNDEKVNIYIKKADESLVAMGFTEHSFPHVTKVAAESKYILETLGYSDRDAELAQIAGFLHDIGNVINRADHAQSGALLAFRILDGLGADPEDIATIITAIGNHDEHTAFPVSPIAAALILADKSDVRMSRVRNRNFSTFDIHDRVNYAVKSSKMSINEDMTVLRLMLSVDTSHCAVMDYFEIFLERMKLCRRAAERLNLRFELTINGQQLI